ncbi:MAG: cytosine/adenosine deaminase-related metal-dependent hydrolase [Desulforhopalus sp.]|jgi:cytosine/adenosine deaminase-related metal-dependent hydrolase
MKVLHASWVICFDHNNKIIQDGAVVFDNTIIDVGKVPDIKEKYPDIEIEKCGENSVLMPGLINSHVHLEFSANSTTLKYGSFMDWLRSVMTHREKLTEQASTSLILSKLTQMLNTGTTTIGAISSHDFEMEACLESPINTVYFAEVIGPEKDLRNTVFADFKKRVKSIKRNQSSSFIPAIAIHSPYSTHPLLVRNVLALSKEDDLAVSAHFLESKEECMWLHKNEGVFLEFFTHFLGQDKAATTPMAFLNQFEHIKHLSFTHCVEASVDELKKISKLGAVINHCVTSNRLLNNTKLDLPNLQNNDYSIGTDGLSSNNSLSMFDELRNALMMHTCVNINDLAKELLIAATRVGAKALGLEKGVLSKGKDADMIVCNLPGSIENEADLFTHIILHTKFATQIIINGIKHG